MIAYCSSINYYLVDFTDMKIKTINLISTWLTCENYCWTVVGTSNLYQIPEEPNKFQVYLKNTNGRTLSKTHITGKFVLHYKIEGLC